MKHQQRDIVLYYAMSFLMGFYIANGTTVLFAQKIGLSYSAVFTLSAVYMLMFILFEIPTGALADLIGRKKTIMSGLFMLVVAAVASGVSANFIQLFSSYFLWACGFSLISGASEALMYDRVNDNSLYSRIVGKSSFYSIIGMAAAGIVGPYLFSLHFRLPYLITAIPFLIAAICIGFFHENHVAIGFTWKRHVDQITAGIKHGWNNTYVLWSTGILALLFAVAYTFSNVYQPYFISIGFPVETFSFILPIMFVIQAAGGWAFDRILKIGESNLFWISILGIVLLITLMGILPFQGALGIVFAFRFLEGVSRPLVSVYTNRYIESSHRATVISVQGMVGTIVTALMLFLIGYLTDRIGIYQVLMVMGGIVLLVGVPLLAMKPKGK